MNTLTEIHSNGSKWGGEEPDGIDSLLARLKTHALDPRFEKYGNFVIHDPIAADSDRRLLPDGGVNFFGNFLTYSHVFNISTTDGELIALLTAAICENQASEMYAEAKRAETTRRERMRKEEAARHAAYLKRMFRA